MHFSPKYQDTNKACSWKLGVQLIKKYDLFGRARECWLCFFGETPRTMWTQISTMEPEDKKVVDRQHPFLSSSMHLNFFQQKSRNLFPEFWMMGCPVYHFTCLPRNERNIHVCFQMPISSSEVDRLDSKNVMASHGVESTFQSPEIDFTPRRKNKNEILLCFSTYLLEYLLFVLLRLNLFPMSWAGSPRPRDILFLAKMGSLPQV